MVVTVPVHIEEARRRTLQYFGFVAPAGKPGNTPEERLRMEREGSAYEKSRAGKHATIYFAQNRKGG